MNEAQIAFLFRVAERIPRLLAALENGNQHAEYVIGKRIIAGQQVRLVLLAEVIDPGDNPLATHSSRVAGTAPSVSRSPARRGPVPGQRASKP